MSSSCAASGDDWRFLLLRAFNHWDFPKGMVEAGEQPLEAAVREVREESLIDDLDFAWGEDSTQTGPYSGGKVARYYLASTRQTDITLPFNPEIGRRRAQRIPLGRVTTPPWNSFHRASSRC